MAKTLQYLFNTVVPREAIVDDCNAVVATLGRGLGGLGRWQVLMAAPIKPLLTAALMPLAQKP